MIPVEKQNKTFPNTKRVNEIVQNLNTPQFQFTSIYYNFLQLHELKLQDNCLVYQGYANFVL